VLMNSEEITTEDDLRPEYDLKELKVRRVGPRRKSFAGTVPAELRSPAEGNMREVGTEGLDGDVCAKRGSFKN
jgi:hypothetical protein